VLQFAQADKQVDHAEAGDGAPHEIIQKKAAQRKVEQHDVVFPESRPGHEDKKKADLEAEKN